MRKFLRLCKATALIAATVLVLSACGSLGLFAESDEYLLVYKEYTYSNTTGSGVERVKYEYEYEIGENGDVCLKHSNQSAYFDDGSESVFLSSYECDAFGKPQREIQYDRYGRENDIYVVYEYDDDGILLRTVEHSCIAEKDYVTYVCEYDQSGEIISDTFYNYDGSVAIRDDYEYVVDEYDEKGSAVKGTCFGKGEYLYSWEKTYDENGNLVKETYISNGVFHHSVENVYMTEKEYFASKETNSGYDSYEDVAKETVDAIVSLNAEKLLKMEHDELLAVLLARSDMDECVEELNEEIERKCGDVLDVTESEDYELSWEIIKKEEYTSDETDDLMEEIGDYPQIDIEEVLDLTVAITAAAKDGNSADASVAVTVLKTGGSWYFVTLDEPKSDRGHNDTAYDIY